MSEQNWSIKPQVVRDSVTGLQFAFKVFPARPEQGVTKPHLVMTISRFDPGIPGIGCRDLVFDLDGDRTGSGSGCWETQYTINPEVQDIDGEAWKYGRSPA